MQIKFNCSNPACQQRIAVDESMAGRSMVCPACSATLKVPDSVNIKFNCSQPDCGQHIIVDVSEAGRFIRCPACDKPLQIPGAPPKPIVPKHTPKSSSSALPEHPFANSDGISIFVTASPMKRLLSGWCIGAVLFVLLIGGAYWHSKIVLPKNFKGMMNEITSIGDFRGAPVANHHGTAILYPRDIQDGGGIFLADLITQKKSLLIKQDEGGGMDFLI